MPISYLFAIYVSFVKRSLQSILCFLYYHRAKAKTKYFNLESSFCCPKIFQSGIVFSPQLAIWHTKQWHILGKGELFQTFKSRKQTFCVWRLRLGHRHRSTHLNRNGNIYIFPLRILYLFILHHTSLYQTKLLKPDNPSSIIIDG